MIERPRPWMQERPRTAVKRRLILELVAFMWCLIAPVILIGLAGPA